MLIFYVLVVYNIDYIDDMWEAIYVISWKSRNYWRWHSFIPQWLVMIILVKYPYDYQLHTYHTSIELLEYEF